MLLFLLIGLAVYFAAIIAYQAYRIYFLNVIPRPKFEPVIQPIRVFQIGFSKCGTKTLADFFNSNQIWSLHHGGGLLAYDIYNNYWDGKPLLTGYESYYGFFDMEVMYEYPTISIPMLLFKELDRQYPGSKFILNIRDKQAWLKSKASHPAYHYGKRWLQLHADFYDLTTDEVLAMWSRQWDEHYAAVQEYFKDRPDDLLIFDIEKDSPKKLCKFFKGYFNLNPAFYAHKNKSADREKEKVVAY